MYALHKFDARIGNIGQALPDPYKIFEVSKARFRRGAVSMIAGKPGSMKSILALNMTRRWAKNGMCVYYFCTDSDEATVAARMGAIVRGEPFEVVERRIAQGEREKYHRIIYDALGDNVMWEYERMSFTEIVEHIKAYEAIYGGYPDVIFLDNLVDFVSSQYAFEEMQELLANLDQLAKEIRSHICVLHHARLEEDQKKNKDEEPRPKGNPPPDREISGKITQKPRLVLTVGALGLHLKAAVVKNSLGPQDREAENPFEFKSSSNLRVKDMYE